MIHRTTFFSLAQNLYSSKLTRIVFQQSLATAKMLLDVIGNGGSVGACLVSAYCSDWPRILGLPVAHHGQGRLPICLDLQFPK